MEHESQQDPNEAYLSTALTWLRLKLASLAPPVETPPPPAPEEDCERSWFSFGRRCEREEDAPNPEPEPTGDPLAKAEEAMLTAEKSDPPPAMAVLAERLQLSRFEQRLLLLCAAPELDTRIPGLCAEAQGDPHKGYPTFALAFALFPDDASWDALSPERPLRYWRLLEINQPGATPLTSSALRADERIVNYLKGLNELDDRLSALFTPLAAPMELPPSQLASARQLAQQLDWLAMHRHRGAIQLLGIDNTSKQHVAQAALQHSKTPYFRQVQPLRLRDELLPIATGELETFLRLWDRESLLLPILLYIELTDSGGNQAERISALNRLLERTHGLVLLDTRDSRPELGAEVFTLEVGKPTPAEQQQAWLAHLGEDRADIAARLAGQFNFTLPVIAEIAHQFAETPPQSNPEQALRKACLNRTRQGLEKRAQRIDVKADWDQIVLPEETLGLLKAIEAQVGQRHRVYDEWGFRDRMNRGLGISALFAGESGTGKTMAAEVIANALGIDLYRIDLSAVVSKYIGETEKNLRKVFDAAENGGAILFFDEADALFGKRSEVKDSHDRYANIEINYLLQRMEAFSGLAILATNLKNALDPAFTRRLRFVIDFAFPGISERQRIWEKAFPSSIPKGDLDYPRLARFSLSGGSIHNIALNAAFLAAQENNADQRKVSMKHVLTAAKAEFRKLDMPINARDFRLPENEETRKFTVV